MLSSKSSHFVIFFLSAARHLGITVTLVVKVWEYSRGLLQLEVNSGGQLLVLLSHTNRLCSAKSKCSSCSQHVQRCERLPNQRWRNAGPPSQTMASIEPLLPQWMASTTGDFFSSCFTLPLSCNSTWLDRNYLNLHTWRSGHSTAVHNLTCSLQADDRTPHVLFLHFPLRRCVTLWCINGLIQY